MPSNEAKKFNHGEAFRLMKYRCDQGCHSEIIWNSRDGVTPFIVRSHDGVHDMTHVEWRTDVFAPDHVPNIGDRIFVGMTEERARVAAEQYVTAIWTRQPTPASESGYWESREACIDYFADKFYREHGEGETPDLVEVDRERFRTILQESRHA